jgi:uncharacterized protein YdbL (DUF1318 family)
MLSSLATEEPQRSLPMLRHLALIALVPVLLAASPALAVTAKEKKATCTVGADAEHLAGAKRTAFIKKCMAKGNYEPAARKAELQKEKAMKKSAAKKPAAKKKTAAKPLPKMAPPPQEKNDGKM